MGRSKLTRTEQPASPIPATESGNVLHIVLHPEGIAAVVVIVDVDNGVKQAHRCLNFASVGSEITVFGEKVDVGQLCNWFVKHNGGKTVRVTLHPVNPGGSVSNVAEFLAV